MMHNFWPSEDASERTGNMFHFMKHAALAGGALALLGVEELWDASVHATESSLADKMRVLGPGIASNRNTPPSRVS